MGASTLPVDGHEHGAGGEARDPRAKRPLTVLAGPYGHPLHPPVVALPIGMWVSSVVFDALSWLSPDPQPFVVGGRWLLGLGLAAATLAALVGLLDFVLLPGRTRVLKVALIHIACMLTASALFGTSLLLRLAQPSQSAVSAELVALSLLALALIAAGGWLGGELAFRYGVRVADEATQLEGFEGPTDERAAADPPGSEGSPAAHRRNTSHEHDRS